MNVKFLITALLIFMAAPAFAEFTVDDTVDPVYLKNHGYSDFAIWTAQKTIAYNNGEELKEPIENPLYEKPVIKQVRRFFMYLDPALDEHSFFNDHDIKATTRYDNL